jgi:hypothetical protein
MASAMSEPPRTERRASRRWSFFECAWLRSARLRHGPDVTVLNLSGAGALVEARARLLPGGHVDLQLVAAGWQASAAAHVLRCQVSGVVPEHGVRYRAALQFDEQILLPGGADEASDEDGPIAGLGIGVDWTVGRLG